MIVTIDGAIDYDSMAYVEDWGFGPKSHRVEGLSPRAKVTVGKRKHVVEVHLESRDFNPHKYETRRVRKCGRFYLADR